MAVLLPLAKVPDAEFVKIVRQIKAKAMQAARQLIDAKDLITRPLRPRDLGLTTDEWTFNVASTGLNENMVNKELDNKTMVVIYGIYNLSTSPVVNEVKFGTPASIIEDLYLEDMYMYDIPAVILDPEDGVITYEPGSTVKIDFVSKGTNSAEKLGFLGIVIEPANRRMTK